MKNSQMVELKSKLDKIISFIKDKNDVVFIDYPAHHNVGDLLIFHGAINLFQEHNVNIKVFRSVIDYNYDDLKDYVSVNTTILCHGGGNFGDIYPIHQNLRETIANDFPENRIIILPQTAYYSSEEKFNKSQQILSKHKDLFLFARDEKTYNLFCKISSNSYLCPDMAHALYRKIKKSKRKKNEVLYFLRADCEINESQLSLNIPSDIAPKDWADFINANDRRFRSFISYMFSLSSYTNSSFLRNVTASLWRYHCKKLVLRSFLYFSQYNEVITSRMHGHILSCLVDVPNKIIDNSYGKNSGYYNQWTKGISSSSLLDTNKETQ